MTPRPARLVIVDDHRLFADGLAALNEAGGSDYSITAYDSPEAFLADLAEGLAPDLVILDLVMKQMNGLAVLAALRKRGARFPVLMLSGIADEPPVSEMRALGADGFLHKSADQETLLEAVEALLAGGKRFDAEADLQDVDRDFSPPALAARQLEVLRLIGEGAGNRAIAERLGISENTVKSHLRAVYDALDANSRTAAVRKAQLLGMI